MKYKKKKAQTTFHKFQIKAKTSVSHDHVGLVDLEYAVENFVFNFNQHTMKTFVLPGSPDGSIEEGEEKIIEGLTMLVKDRSKEVLDAETDSFDK